MITSLRGRLFVGLTAIIITAGTAGGIFTYKWAFDEAIEIQDSALIQIAGLAQNGGVGHGQPVHGIEENAEVRVVELGSAARDPANADQLFVRPDGLQTATWKGEPFRALLRTRPDGSRFAVLQPTAVRDDTARDMAFRTLLPMVALMPFLMLVTAFVVSYSLRPMVRLAEGLDARRASDLSALPLTAMPSELHPFVTSINRLLVRIQVLMDQQRRLVADAAHELRTPVAALSLQAENLDHLKLPQAARNRVAALKLGMQRTKHLLDQLLALARHEIAPSRDDDMPPASLDRAASELVAELLPYALERRIDLGSEVVQPLTVRAEPSMLATVIRNLLDNALRCTPDGGRVNISVYRDCDAAVVQVDDTGPGIAPDDLDRIFEPFFRGSKPEGEGSGLGLAIVKRVIDRLGGTIALENIHDSSHTGLRAVVRLPLAIEADRAAAATLSSKSPAEKAVHQQ